MRRIAAELGAGTMTLYHYVRTKDELLTLVSDAVMGEVVVPDDERCPTNWRDAIVMLAERSRAALQRHPWILDITDDPAIGPNSVRHFDQSLAGGRVASDQLARQARHRRDRRRIRLRLLPARAQQRAVRRRPEPTPTWSPTSTAC